MPRLKMDSACRPGQIAERLLNSSESCLIPPNQAQNAPAHFPASLGFSGGPVRDKNGSSPLSGQARQQNQNGGSQIRLLPACRAWLQSGCPPFHARDLQIG